MTKGVLKSALSLNSAQRAELDRRLHRLKKTGPLGADWETVKKRIQRRR